MRTARPASLRWAVALGAVTAVALALRLDGLHESLFADELYTLRIVRSGGLGDVLDSVAGSAITPPLHYVLAWLSTRLGEDETTIRLPSLVLGTAAVPAVYLLARELGGQRAGLLAAAMMALSPLAIYFSTEARTYATVLFLMPVSTFALLRAIESRRNAWWGLYATASALALYSHYTVAIPLGVQAAWVLWTERSRRAVMANALIALAYLPWLPALLGQDRESGTAQIESIHRLSLESAAEAIGRLLFGHQLVGLGEVPGSAAAWLFVAALVGVAAGWAVGIGRGGPVGPLALVALSAPLAALLYSLAGTDIFTARNLLASLPALMVLVSLLIARLPAGAAVPAAAALLVALGIGTAKTLEPELHRPPLRQAAEFVDRRAAPGDPVVEVVFLGYRGLFTHHLDINFDRPHPFSQTGLVQRPGRDPWARALRSDRFFVVSPGAASGSIPGVAAGRFGVADTHVWRGITPVTVTTLRRATVPGTYRLARRDGEEVVVGPGGRTAAIGRGGVVGHLDEFRTGPGGLALSGWAGRAGGAPAETVAVFVRGRFLTAIRPLQARPDVAAARGDRLLHSGFALRLPEEGRALEASEVRVFAVSGVEAVELDDG